MFTPRSDNIIRLVESAGQGLPDMQCASAVEYLYGPFPQLLTKPLHSLGLFDLVLMSLINNDNGVLVINIKSLEASCSPGWDLTSPGLLINTSRYSSIFWGKFLRASFSAVI